MKICKKLSIFLITLTLCLCTGITAFATEGYDNEPYYFTGYDININVLENNSLEITEHISAYFNEERHGIYRDIPTRSIVSRADGTSTSIKARVKDIKASEECYVSDELNYKTLRIGSKDTTITGAHDYTISYTYELGEDRNNGFDEFYYNIIGTGWDTYIQNVTFTITMPKEFDAARLGFSTGSYHTEGTYIVDYSVDGATITGRLTEDLEPYKALTIRLELDDGYFYFNKPLYYTKLALLVAIPLLAVAIVFVLWKKYGDDDEVVESVVFYPPENMSSADVAYWYTGKITSRQLVPLLIELANEGYIEINEIETRGLIKPKTSFEIKKVKDEYRGNDKNKRLFFNGLFENADYDCVYEDDLKNNFYTTLNRIVMNYNDFDNRVKVFEKSSLYTRLVGWFVSAISIGGCILFSSLIVPTKERAIATITGIALGVFAFVFSFFIRKRTDHSHKILEQIKGFKTFLETAEKERLEALVEENPQYFYDILPYAYVLGVSDKWISKFENITLAPPTWYSSHGMYNYYIFHHFIDRTMTTSANVMTSAPQSSGSGGGGFTGGGGGFSGGGVGGGGGGSW